MRYLLDQGELDAMVSKKALAETKLKIKKAGDWVLEEVVGDKCWHVNEGLYPYCDDRCPLVHKDARILCDRKKAWPK